jgi:rhodanese-related sulfurtransferase
MKRWLYLVAGMLGCGIASTQQSLDRPHCRGPLFNKMVHQMLSHSVPQLDVDSLEKGISNYLILDARERVEYDISHIQNAKYIGSDDPDWKVLKGIEKDKPIAIYCSIGYRSEKIAEQLIKRGFTNVYNVYGSIFEWVNRGYPVVEQNGKVTKKLHGYSRTWGIWVNNNSIELSYK